MSHVQSVTDVIQNIGNPFSEISADLYTLDTKVIMGECVVKTIRTAEDVGIAQYQRFINERVSDKTADFNNTIRKRTIYNCLTLAAPVRQLIDRHLRWSV